MSGVCQIQIDLSGEWSNITIEADVVEYGDMITIIRDRIQDMIKRGMTLEQVKAARPTRDYDGRYGSPTLLIEAAYRDLSR